VTKKSEEVAFEEANQLIGSCQKRLAAAEQKVEKLIKTRQGELALDAGGQPQTESL